MCLRQPGSIGLSYVYRPELRAPSPDIWIYLEVWDLVYISQEQVGQSLWIAHLLTNIPTTPYIT
jgi:hypothetical protein